MAQRPDRLSKLLLDAGVGAEALGEPGVFVMIEARDAAARGTGSAPEAATHDVHVYHWDGEIAEGKPILRPQTSFGVFVDHEGTLYGWDTELGGGLVEIAPNVYRLGVPEEGGVTITQVIAAGEASKRPGCLPLVGRVIALFRRLGRGSP